MVLESEETFRMWVLVGVSLVIGVFIWTWMDSLSIYFVVFHVLERHQQRPPVWSIHFPPLFFLSFCHRNYHLKTWFQISNRWLYDRSSFISERKCHSREALSTCQPKIQELPRGLIILSSEKLKAMIKQLIPGPQDG